MSEMVASVEGSVAAGVVASADLYCQVQFIQELSAEMSKRLMKHGVRYKV